MFYPTLIFTCLLIYVNCSPIYSGDGRVEDHTDMEYVSTGKILKDSDMELVKALQDELTQKDDLISSGKVLETNRIDHFKAEESFYTENKEIEDGKFDDFTSSPNVVESEFDDKLTSSNELIAAEFLEESPFLPKSNISVPTFNQTEADGVDNDVPMLFPTYEEEMDENPDGLMQSADYNDNDYNEEDIQHSVLLRRRFDNTVPVPLQNLPHDIPPDRTIAEVLAENTIKDIQYDEQRIKELVQELLSHTSLQSFGEIYSDDVDDNEIPVMLK